MRGGRRQRGRARRRARRAASSRTASSTAAWRSRTTSSTAPSRRRARHRRHPGGEPRGDRARRGARRRSRGGGRASASGSTRASTSRTRRTRTSRRATTRRSSASRCEDVPRAVALAEARAEPRARRDGVHVGSQLKHIAPYLGAARVLFDRCAPSEPGAPARARRSSTREAASASTTARAPPSSPVEFVRAARAEQRLRGLDDLALYVEPGRCLVAAHGVLVARVIQAKVASASALAHDRRGDERPHPPGALPGAPPHRAARQRVRDGRGVALARRRPGLRELRRLRRAPPAARPAAHVAILDAGAYGYTMASRYNGRRLPGGGVRPRREDRGEDRPNDRGLVGGGAGARGDASWTNDLSGELAAVVLARHRVAVGARVEDGDRVAAARAAAGARRSRRCSRRPVRRRATRPTRRRRRRGRAATMRWRAW